LLLKRKGNGKFMLTAVVGINWGDEGKGRIVDLLSEDQDVVVRYQGGNNAGHTVINEKGEFILNLLPSGILRENVVCVMGNGMAIDLQHLHNEIERLREKGIHIGPDNLKISDRAVVTMPYHVDLDCYEEERLGKNSYGSTRRGIAPVYSDKYAKKAIRTGDLLHEKYLQKVLPDILAYKNLIIEKAYNKPGAKLEAAMEYLHMYGEEFQEYICDTGAYLYEADKAGKRIMFEAQLGALRDIDYGIYPFTSSSNTIAAYAPIGAGVPGLKLDTVVGIMKAYSTCVGAGPFTVEMDGEEAQALRTAGGEFGAATGRPRRVGAFDVVASKYGILAQGSDKLALTKLDVLSYMKKIPVCVAYSYNGELIRNFPVGEALDLAQPVFEYLDGWCEDISSCRSFGELPENAKKYIEYIEEKVEQKMWLISVGAKRDAYFMR
jgi:adenylosuccinate synthase